MADEANDTGTSVDKVSVESKIGKGDFRDPFSEGSMKFMPMLITTKLLNLTEERTAVAAKLETIRAVKTSTDEERKSKRESIAELDEYEKVLTETLKGMWNDGTYDDIFKNMADWTQAITMDGRVMTNRIGKVSAKPDDEGRITGKHAVLTHFSSATGVGKPSTGFLPDTGISITLANFTEKSILRIIMILNETRQELGANHKGAMFTSDDSKLNVQVAEYCFAHAVGSSLRDTTVENLMAVFVITDLFSLIAIAMTSLYPDGYPFLYTCMNKETCTFETFTMNDGELDAPRINYNRVVWLNHKKFDAARFQFIMSPNGTKTVAQVLEHQEKYAYQEVVVGPLNEKSSNLIRIKIRPPRFLEYREMTYTWLSEITATVNKILADIDSDIDAVSAQAKRRNYLSEAIRRLTLQRHASWITEVMSTNGDESISTTTRQDVLDALEGLCSDKEVVVNLTNEIEKAKMKMASSMTGIPVFKCPKCSTIQYDKDKPSALIPRNLVADFFYTMALRHQG